MPTVSIDIRELSGVDPGVDASRATFDFWPYAPVHVEAGSEDYLLDQNILKVKTVDGLASVVLPETPTGNAMWVQGRGYKGAGRWLVAIPAGDCNLWDLPHLDETTLDPTVAPSPAWLAALAAETTARTTADTTNATAAATAQSTADSAVAGLSSKVNSSTYTAGLASEATTRATADALLQPIATLDAAIAPYATGKTTLTPGRSTEELAPAFVASGGDLVTHASLGMPTIQTMMAFCTDGIIASPLGRFYAYICTDHDSAGTPEPWNGKGGFVLVYANSPTGPWTIHRDGGGNLVIYQDTVVGNQTETPSPLYVPDDPAGKPIYVYYQNQGAGLNQSTVLARSATGLPNDFERVGIVIQGRGTASPVWPGDGQSTYMQPMRVEGQILAVHLMGGGNWAQYGRSYSPDGRNFITDPRRFGHFSHLVGSDNARRVAIRSIFQWRGNPWAVVTIGAHTSGFLTDPRQLGFARLSSDLRRVVGKVHILADSTINAGTVIENNGRLYMFYRTGDAYSAFRCAIAEA